MITITAINLGHEITVTAPEPETASIIIRQLLTAGWVLTAHQTFPTETE